MKGKPKIELFVYSTTSCSNRNAPSTEASPPRASKPPNIVSFIQQNKKCNVREQQTLWQTCAIHDTHDYHIDDDNTPPVTPRLKTRKFPDLHGKVPQPRQKKARQTTRQCLQQCHGYVLSAKGSKSCQIILASSYLGAQSITLLAIFMGVQVWASWLCRVHCAAVRVSRWTFFLLCLAFQSPSVFSAIRG